jgi:hypothetical protein
LLCRWLWWFRWLRSSGWFNDINVLNDHNELNDLNRHAIGMSNPNQIADRMAHFKTICVFSMKMSRSNLVLILCPLCGMFWGRRLCRLRWLGWLRTLGWFNDHNDSNVPE